MGLLAWLAGIGLVFLALAYLRQRLLPVPLTGIPYNDETTNRLLGDIGPIKARARLTRETTESMFGLARELGKPIAQILTPFPRRIVLVDDPVEVENILTRRHHEFDRSIMTSQFFMPLFPRCTISQPTTPHLRTQKRLWAGIMNTTFLDRVVAPNVQLAAQDLVELWRLKTIQYGGESFEVSKDFANTALDAIWVAILGSRLGATRREINQLQNGAPYKEKANQRRQTQRALSSATVVQEAVESLNKIVYLGFTSLWPPLSIFLFQLTPTYRRFKKIAFDEVRVLMTQAWKRYQRIEAKGSETDGEELDTCAMDLVLRREALTAKKTGQPIPDPTNDPAMLEELLFLLLAGHESTASTLSWFVKLIALHPTVQTALRSNLRKTFLRAINPGTDEHALPSSSQILSTPLPYLDATIHEMLRFCVPAGAVARRATRDTTVLGCPIAEGMHLMLNTRVDRLRVPIVPEPMTYTKARVKGADRGVDMETAGLRVEQAARRDPNRGWNWDLSVFEPRRWLVRDENGGEVFDGNALPTLVFGGGFRGCFGKKLAMRELRIIITMLVLSFEFLPLPPEQSSMEAEERLFRKPRMCHVKLRPL